MKMMFNHEDMVVDKINEKSVTISLLYLPYNLVQKSLGIEKSK